MMVENQAVAGFAGRNVLSALKSASARTGSDFGYLLATAMRESHLQTDAKSTTSSAGGLFQFVDQTWLSLLKRYGAKYGLGGYADAIRMTDCGRYDVASGEMKSAILALKEDPNVSALMAGESAREARTALECQLGRKVCSGELYAAHFLGEAAARQLIALNEQHPQALAADLFRQAAKANRAVFYHADGSPKTVSEVYDWAVKSAIPASGDARTIEIAAAPAHDGPPLVPPADGAQASQLILAADGNTASPAKTNPASPGAAPPGRFVARPALVLNPAVIAILSALSPAAPAQEEQD